MELQFIQSKVDVTFSPDGMLAWPTAWTDELRERGFIEAAVNILTHLPSAAVTTPWIIGSGKYSLSGSERTDSLSHEVGKAFDMSPMYDATNILAPNGQLMGLAWNVADLYMLAQAYVAYPHFVVEGDHIHVQPHADLAPDMLLVAFTMPRWYEWTQRALEDKTLSHLENTFWLWSCNDLSLALAPARDAELYLSALKDDTYETAS